jgi:UDP-glucose 6-dehydrogenase
LPGRFKNPDFDAIKALLKQPVVIDGRNLYATNRC